MSMTAAVASAAEAPADDRGTRSASLDVTRGLVVALMALDHVRIFFSAAQFDPVDLDATTPGFFFTRWVTHLCAPGFFVLAGVGASLMQARSDRRTVAKFLATRGLWLIALEFLVFGLAWSFSPGWFWFGVIWGLGASMLALSGLLWLGRPAVLAAGLLFTLIHNAAWGALAGLPPAADILLYSGGAVETGIAGPRLVLYPLLPWLALMMIGYGVGTWLVPNGRLSVPRACKAGFAALGGFILLRLTGFGEPRGGGAEGGEWVRALLSFFNVEKYPPSLQFSCLTLGLLLLFAAWVERSAGAPGSPVPRPLHVFGEVPFFFYLLHIFIIHALALGVAAGLGWPTDYLFWSGAGPNLAPPPGYGFRLPGIYAVWVAVLALLLPLCRSFAELKRTRRSWWLKYL